MSTFISLPEAQSLGYGHPNTLRRHIKAGCLPGRMIGRIFKVSVEDLEAWSRTTAPASSSPAKCQGCTPQDDEIFAAAKQVATAWPDLSSEQKADVAFILSATVPGGGQR